MFNLIQGSLSLLYLAFIRNVKLKCWTAVVHLWPGASCLTSMFALWDYGWFIAANAGYLSTTAAWVSSRDHTAHFHALKCKNDLRWECFSKSYFLIIVSRCLTAATAQGWQTEEQSSTFCVPHCPHTRLQHACLPQQNEKSIHVSHLPHLCRTIDPDTMISQCERYYFQ